MDQPDRNFGDEYLLFQRFPFDFSSELPLAVGEGVLLDNTPVDLLNSLDEGLPDFLLPGFSLSGFGMCHCCLRSDRRARSSGQFRARDLLFQAVLALRLHTPAYLEIGGAFASGVENGAVENPTLYNMPSSWTSGEPLVYTPAMVSASNDIANRLLEINPLAHKRLLAGLVYFAHASIGWSRSYQLSYIGLFAALEALFVPQHNKAKELSRRAASLLGHFELGFPVSEWLCEEYVRGRSKLVHGVHAGASEYELAPQKKVAFGRLHEITRLALLGFLSLADSQLQELSSSNGPTLQQALDGVNVGIGGYVEGQRSWAT